MRRFSGPELFHGFGGFVLCFLLHCLGDFVFYMGEENELDRSGME